MLSLVSALVLLALNGPAAVERLEQQGRLPAALRALERAWAPPQETDAVSGLADSRETIGISPWEAQLELAQALTEYLSAALECAAAIPTHAGPEVGSEEEPFPAAGMYGEAERAVRDGCLACRRTRDGPKA
jgi:hypothetical protein